MRTRFLPDIERLEKEVTDVMDPETAQLAKETGHLDEATAVDAEFALEVRFSIGLFSASN